MHTNHSTDLGLLLIRLMVGAVLIYHGQAKLFGGLDQFAGFLATMHVPAPHVAAALSALAEFGGGLVLVSGLAFRYALWPIVVNMAVASLAVHGNGFSVLNGGMEYPLTLGVAVLALIFTGPGRWTVAAFLPEHESAAAAAPKGA